MSGFKKFIRDRDIFSVKAGGSSMLPMLHTGDIIEYKKIRFNKICSNDLLLLQLGSRIITHRVIYKSANYLISKGDNNFKSDGIIQSDKIVGKVSQVKRNRYLFNPENLYLIQSAKYIREIIRIKKLFDRRKIHCVFLKGLPLQLHYEKSFPRRIYADCDVLVNYKDFEQIKKILVSAGYVYKDTSYSFLHKFLKDKPTEAVFTKIINHIPVVFDIHFELNFLMNQLGRIDPLYPQIFINKFTEEAISSLKSIALYDERLFILNSSLLIQYLALHVFHHNYRGAFRYEFLDKIIRKDLLNLNLNQIQYNIRKYKVEGFIYPVFYFLKKYYRTPLSEKFMQSILPDNIRMNYIKKNILTINIFDDETRTQSGIRLFVNIFYLSSEPLWKKIVVLFNVQVFYSFWWVMMYKFIRSLRGLFKTIH